MITLNPVQLAVIVVGTFYFGRRFGRLEAVAYSVGYGHTQEATTEDQK